MKKVLILTGGGDCPGLNAVIRAVVKCATREGWQAYGSIEAYHGLLKQPYEVIPLTNHDVRGIHFRGGTIIGTTNKGDPFRYPVQQEDGQWVETDRSGEVLKAITDLGINAVISVGGDGSQRISKKFHDLGVPVIGVPKTIDNDLAATDQTFGYQTAVQTATEALDRLVTTASSHHRTMILEVMGRDAGWIAIQSAIAGGAEVCLIPEIPYDIGVVIKSLETRYEKGRGFANIVIAEGAKPIGGTQVGRKSTEAGYGHVHLGGVAYQLADELKAGGFKADIRVNVLGHTQRGGVPLAFDRVLATLFGVKAFELARDGRFGRMVSLRGKQIVDVSLEEATSGQNLVNPASFLVQAARDIGICMGDA